MDEQSIEKYYMVSLIQIGNVKFKYALRTFEQKLVLRKLTHNGIPIAIFGKFLNMILANCSYYSKNFMSFRNLYRRKTLYTGVTF